MTGELELGLKYRDKVSGWEGTAVARYIYLNGCVRYELASKDKDGKPESFVFDEQQVELFDNDPDPIAVSPSRRSGGPRDNRPVVR